jgi:hypothetical protein
MYSPSQTTKKQKQKQKNGKIGKEIENGANTYEYLLGCLLGLLSWFSIVWTFSIVCESHTQMVRILHMTLQNEPQYQIYMMNLASLMLDRYIL